MATVDWDEYKEFKKFSHREDKLEITIDFIKSYYNKSNPSDIYNMLKDDDIGQMFLERKDITDEEGLENYMFKS